MLLGQCGLLSFGHSVFFGLGGFFAIHALKLSDGGGLYIPTPLIPLVGGLFGLLIGIIIAPVVTKKAGATFALITVGINEIVATSALMFKDFFGSETGIQAMRQRFLWLTFGSALEVYYLVYLWAFICMVAMYLIEKTPLGKVANAVRDNPDRTSFVGYNPVKVRGIYLTLSGFFAGIGGGLYAITWEQMSYDNVSGAQSAIVLFMAYIGGTGYFYGPIIGALLVTILTFYLSSYTEAWLLYLGIFFVIICIYAPTGIAGIIMYHKAFWKAGKLKQIISSYVKTILPVLMITFVLISVVEILFRWSGRGYMKATMNIYGNTIYYDNIWLWVALLALGVIGSGWFALSFKKTRNEVASIVREIEIAGAK
jgi:branched-chain amino acid transport system permease protein